MKNIEKLALFDMAANLKQKPEVLEYSVDGYPNYFSVPPQLRSPGPPAVTRDGRPKIGRNAPCPCKSGKKFKKCCYTHPYTTFYKGGK